MPSINSFTYPEITQDDIDWVTSVMSLPVGAFNDEARKKALLARVNMDIAACPGSGKTTLLVAKLAILARKWKDRTQGICVLSHTNAAREVIQERLGSTAEGQTLLSHPHYIGTIHGFVDRFLGIPYLNTKNWDAYIDDIRCSKRIEEQIRFQKDVSFDFKKSYLALSYRNSGEFFNLKLSYSNKEVHVRCGRNLKEDHLSLFPPGTTLRKITEFQKVVKHEVCKSGIHTYDDMFAFGHRLLEKGNGVDQLLSTRFPLLFIDEAQDNSELQSNILHRVFNAEYSCTICQRFGDANQAIYHSISSEDAPTTWKFPNPKLKHNVPDSYRFGQTIGSLAQPLGIEKHELVGRGPTSSKRTIATEVDDRHTVFLFDENAIAHVLPAYSNHLKRTFSPGDLAAGSFVAVGAKHREPTDVKNKPNSVCDYWGKYEPTQAAAEPRPESFIGYLQSGNTRSQKDSNHNLYHIVEQIAAGLIEAVRRTGAKVPRVQRKSRHVRERLIGHPNHLANYQEFIRRYGIDKETLTPEIWDKNWKAKILGIIETLCDGNTKNLATGDFLDWTQIEHPTLETPRSSILYQSSDDAPVIRLGSIHSVKGETHTGVLVLETYTFGYSLGKTKDWLLNQNRHNPGKRDTAKLKALYVAMTRPTHLLCLAVPRTTFSNGELSTLSDLGWRITKIASDGNTSDWVKP